MDVMIHVIVIIIIIVINKEIVRILKDVRTSVITRHHVKAIRKEIHVKTTLIAVNPLVVVTLIKMNILFGIPIKELGEIKATTGDKHW
jgi:hypothetical protein